MVFCKVPCLDSLLTVFNLSGQAFPSKESTSASVFSRGSERHHQSVWFFRGSPVEKYHHLLHNILGRIKDHIQLRG